MVVQGVHKGGACKGINYIVDTWIYISILAALGQMVVRCLAMEALFLIHRGAPCSLAVALLSKALKGFHSICINLLLY